MDSQAIQPPHNHQLVIDRFVAACQADERVLAAFLGGSYARGAADAYSDLDLYLITTDEAYDDFLNEREPFIRQLGEPVFLEKFDEFGFDLLLFIFSDGTEGELGLGRVSHFHHIHGGPYKVLLDKTGILTGTSFPLYEPPQAAQVETLRGLIHWFWHDLSHFITAMGRGKLWSAYGNLEELRRVCMNLARLRQNFSMAAEGYAKVEEVLPVEQLSRLKATVCPPEPESMLHAALLIVSFYQELAPPLAQAHGLTYPEGLERVMSKRLDRLCEERLS